MPPELSCQTGGRMAQRKKKKTSLRSTVKLRVSQATLTSHKAHPFLWRLTRRDSLLTATPSLTQGPVAYLHFFPLIGEQFSFLRARFYPWPSSFALTWALPVTFIPTSQPNGDLTSALRSPVCLPDLGLGRHLTSRDCLLLQGKLVSSAVLTQGL